MAASWNLDEPTVPEGSVRVGVVFIRHGESEWNAQSRIQGHHGGGLTPTGQAQAQAAAEFLHRAYPVPSLVVSSDLRRSVETAQAYLEQCGYAGTLRYDDRLREVDNGGWSGRFTSEVAAAEADYISRIRNGEDLSRGGGESLANAQHRMCEFTDALTAELATSADPADRWAIVFGHGGPIRLVALAALGLPSTAVRTLGHASNTAITEIEYWVSPDDTPTTARLLEYNSAQHLALGLEGASALHAKPAPVN